MPDPNRFTIKSRRIVTDAHANPFEGAIVVRDGKVEKVLRGSAPTASPLLDVGNLVVMPGLVDTHAHIDEPGCAEWAGFESATREAASGGITTGVDMPLNSTPPTTTVRDFLAKAEAARDRCLVDYGFWGDLVPGNLDELLPLAQAGVLGFKCFLSVDEKTLNEAMPLIARTGLPLVVHAEHDAVRLMIELCRKTGCRVHMAHLSSADALADIEQARASGLPVTAETCPHFLVFSAEEIARESLWKGLSRKTIDSVVSGHSPQFGLPLIWTEARARGYRLCDLVRWMSTNTAKFIGLGRRKGELAPGMDADIVVWNPEANFKVEPSLTPCDGRTLTGVVEMTFLRGEKIYEAGKFRAAPVGQRLERW